MSTPSLPPGKSHTDGTITAIILNILMHIIITTVINIIISIMKKVMIKKEFTVKWLADLTTKGTV